MKLIENSFQPWSLVRLDEWKRLVQDPFWSDRAAQSSHAPFDCGAFTREYDLLTWSNSRRRLKNGPVGFPLFVQLALIWLGIWLHNIPLV